MMRIKDIAHKSYIGSGGRSLCVSVVAENAYFVLGSYEVRDEQLFHVMLMCRWMKELLRGSEFHRSHDNSNGFKYEQLQQQVTVSVQEMCQLLSHLGR